MGIKEDFLSYTKWGATKFTDFFHILLLTNDGDGMARHLQEFRQKTYDAIAALVDGKVDKTQITNTVEIGKIPIYNSKNTLLNTMPKYELALELKNSDYTKIIGLKSHLLVAKLKISWKGTSDSRVAQGELTINVNHNGIIKPIIFGNTGDYGVLGFKLEIDQYGSFNLLSKTLGFVTNTIVVFTVEYLECNDFQFPLSTGWVTNLALTKEFLIDSSIKFFNSSLFEDTMRVNKSSTEAFEVSNDAGTKKFIINTISNEIYIIDSLEKSIPEVPSSFIDTGISVNSGNGGRTIIVIASSNYGSGGSTYSGYYIVRCGYDGNNYDVSIVNESGDAAYGLEFGLIGSNLAIKSKIYGASVYVHLKTNR